MLENNKVRIEEEDVREGQEEEKFHFPWTIAIIVGVLLTLIIACLIVIWVLEH